MISVPEKNIKLNRAQELAIINACILLTPKRKALLLPELIWHGRKTQRGTSFHINEIKNLVDIVNDVLHVSIQEWKIPCKISQVRKDELLFQVKFNNIARKSGSTNNPKSPLQAIQKTSASMHYFCNKWITMVSCCMLLTVTK